MESDNGKIYIATAIDNDELRRGAAEASSILHGIGDNAAKEGASIDETMKRIASSADSMISGLSNSIGNSSLTTLSALIDNQKAHIADLGKEIIQQKGYINEVAQVLRDLQVDQENARKSFKTKEVKELQAQINRTKSDLAEYKQELKDMTLAQAEARMDLREMQNAYKELSATVTDYASITASASNEAEKILLLRNSFREIQATSNAARASIEELSQQSNEAGARAKELFDQFSQATAKPFNTNDSDFAEQFAHAKTLMTEYGEAVAMQSATAETAFMAQKDYVADLEKQIESLQQRMLQAAQAKDFRAAGEIATQVQTLSNELTKAKGRLEELAQKSKEAKTALAGIGEEQAKMEAHASRGTGMLGSVNTEIPAMKQAVGGFFGWLQEKTSNVTNMFKEKTSAIRESVSSAFSNMAERSGLNSFMEKTRNFFSNNTKVEEGIKSFGKAVDALGIPFSAAVAGINKMTLASLRFLATPVGAVLGAIGLALKAVHTWFTKSAEGQRTFAIASAYFGSIMASITDVVIVFGKYLFHAFVDADGPLHDFAVSALKTLKLVFEAAQNWFGGLSDIIHGAFDLDWDTVKSGVAQMGKGQLLAVEALGSAILTTYKSVVGWTKTVDAMMNDEEFGKELSAAFDNIFGKAEEAARLTKKQLDATKEEGEAREKAARLDIEIAEGREKIYRLTGAAKDAEIERVKALMKEKYDDQIAAQKKMLEVQEGRNKLHSVTLEDIAKERELRIKVLETQAAQAASTRLLTRMQESNRRSMEAKEKSAAKSAEAAANRAKNQANAITAAQQKFDEVLYQNFNAQVEAATKLETEITKARIAAMKDGFQRAKADKEEQNLEELRGIEEQKNKAVEAERKRQKALFEAAQAVEKAKGGKIKPWDESEIDQEAIDKITERYEQLFQFTKQRQAREDFDSVSETYDKEITERTNKLNKIKADIDLITQLLSAAETEEEKARLSALLENANAQLKWVEQSKAAWVDYYTKYGTFLEKVKALDEQFVHDTQGMNKETPEFKAKEKKHETDKSALIVEEIKKSVNWESVFGDVSKQSLQVLQYTLERAKELFNANKDSMTPIDAKSFIEAIDKMETEIASRSPFAAWAKSLRDIAVSSKEYKDASRDWKAAQEELDAAQMEYNAALQEQQSIQEKIDGGELTADCNELAEATEKLSKAQDALNKAQQKSNAAESRTLKARNSITKAYQNFARAIGSVNTVVNTLGSNVAELYSLFNDKVAKAITKALAAASEMADATKTMITAIGDLGTKIPQVVAKTTEDASNAIEGTSKVATQSLKTVEKASVILTIISAALQIATQIANLFNDDDQKQEQIDRLQDRIDQLQWEIDNAGTVRLKVDTDTTGLDLVRDALADARRELFLTGVELGDMSRVLSAAFSKASTDMQLMQKAAGEIAREVASASYTDGKWYGREGGSKYDESKEMLENYAQQMLLIDEQIEQEKSKKKSDDSAIKEMEQKLDDIYAKMSDLINSMVEDIIGGSAEDIADQLSDAFFEAFQNGEDAAKAWGDKVNDIVADIVRRMLVQKFLTDRIGKVIDKYKDRWFDGEGNFMGIDEVLASMDGMRSDLTQVGEQWQQIYDALPDDIKEMVDNITGREGASKGIAQASQDSVDELNGRMTAVQGHTFSISENTKLLLATANDILRCVMNIEGETAGFGARLERMEASTAAMRDTLDDIATRGVRLKN